jgi:hydrogenase expression/formation protein HypE
MPDFDEIRLVHGGGGRFSQELVEQVFLPVFGNEYLNALDDSAVFPFPGERCALSTDTFVVHPLFFPGGDIGRLAVCGTVNDLAVMGAKPLYLTLGLVIEEGFSLRSLKKIVESIRKASDEADIKIVAGDTKVVERGSADGIFINTSGVGVLPDGCRLSGTNVRPGDSIVINGPLGRHGMAIVTSREDYGFQSRIRSDVAPLNGLIETMMKSVPGIHAMRDATRGGLATVLNEIAAQSGVTIELDEERIPVTAPVRGACELLGFDPLYVANEGVLVAFVDSREAAGMMEAMGKHHYGKKSAVIGRVTNEPGERVILKTRIGSRRIVDMLSGEQLPRIC